MEGLLRNGNKATVERKILRREEPDVCWTSENTFFFSFYLFVVSDFSLLHKGGFKLGMENYHVWLFY